LALEQTVPDIWLNRGEIRMTCGDIHGAASDIEESIRRSYDGWPRFAEAKAALGKTRGASYP
jgi:hypothetical protein